MGEILNGHIYALKKTVAYADIIYIYPHLRINNGRLRHYASALSVV